MAKKPILILLLLLIYVSACSSQGDKQSSPAKKMPGNFVTAENLFAVDSIKGKYAWITGFEGTILHTSDWGQSWEHQAPEVKDDLFDVDFVDENTGWIVGKYGAILHTTDGGKKWVRQQKMTEQRLFSAFFLDSRTGWVVGTMGTIIHTTDGGKTWTKQGWDEDRYYNGVFFIDSQKGWIAGEYNTIYCTLDGGKTWKRQECKELQPVEPEDDFPAPPPNLYGVYFKSPEVGWITGMDGIIIKTADGGQTWKLLTERSHYTIFQVAGTGKKLWAVGEKGRFLTSDDNGTKWQLDVDSLRTRFWLRDMVFTDENNGWIIGASGTIVRTENGGKEWKRLSGIFIQ